MGSINTARHYRLRNHGAIAPRFWADFLVLDDLDKFQVRQVYKKGVLVAENGNYLGAKIPHVPQPRSTMNLRYRAPEDFVVKAEGTKAIGVIEIVPNQIITKSRSEKPKVRDGEIVSDTGRDILKLVVVERHRATGNVGVSIAHRKFITTARPDAENRSTISRSERRSARWKWTGSPA